MINSYIMKEFFLKKQWATLLLVLSALFVWAACDDSSKDGGPVSVTAPKIIQSEEILDNPITLAFSWESVENAVQYKYQLEEVKEGGNELIVSGSTTGLSVEIASSDKAELLYSTEYVFTLTAVASDASVVSEPAEARVTTGSGPIALSVEDLTYRSAVLKGVPEDKEMLYQFAQVPLEKFTSYGSDLEFIEDYDFGYYKSKSAVMPWIPWYGFMQEGSQKGDYEYYTRILKPEQDYILYAYGVEFNMDDAANPVKVVTPMIKYFFTTPAWKATSDCTFDLSVEKQKMYVFEREDENGEMVKDSIVDMTVKVTPSDAAERYYIGFVLKSDLEKSYGNDIHLFAFDIIYSEEIYNSITDWSESNMLSSGEKVLSSKDFGWGLYPGCEYKAMVFGVNSKGLVTTEIKSIDCVTIGEPAASTRMSAGQSLKGPGVKKAPATSTTDRK